MVKNGLRTIVILITIVISIVFMPWTEQKTNATQMRKDNFNKNYTLTGNGPTDILNIAFAQVGKTGASLGYSEAWCANFVSDCADLAGQSSAIPRTGAVTTIKENTLKAGGYIVNSPQPGDLVIWKNSVSHVEIVSKVENGIVYSIGGNNGSTGNSKTNYVSKEKKVTSVGTVTCYIRPNYSGDVVSSSHSPEGFIGTYAGQEGSIYVDGAGYDPDNVNVQISVHIWLRDDAGNMTVIGELAANGERLDANDRYGCGIYHGFGGTVKTDLSGEFTLLVALLDSGTDDARWIEAGKVTITPSSHSPEICVDYVDVSPSKISIGGWAFDPDNKDMSLDIHVYMDNDNKWIGSTKADYEDDEGLKALIGPASNYKHRFYATFYTTYTGNHKLNIAALDSGNDIERWSGHDINIPQGASPHGNLETVSGGVDSVSFSGYALDSDAGHPSEVNPIEVHFYIDGKAGEGGTCIGITKTGNDRGDGTYTGFSMTAKTDVPTGVHKVYAYAINLEGTGGNHTIIGEADVNIVHVGKYVLTIDPAGGTMKDENGKQTTNAVKTTNNQLIYNTENYYSIASFIPERTGYDFNGFFDADGIKVYDTTGKCIESNYFHNNKYIHTGDLFVMAEWKANSYTVTFDAAGADCFIKNTVVTYDSKYGNLPFPTRKGYIFTGWYTASTGGTKVTSDTKVSITANQTLYAQWKAKTVIGDVNADGKFSVADMVLLERWILAVPDTKLDNCKSADLCEDGVLDVFDLCVMRKMLENS